MIGLRCGKETMTVCLAVSIEYRNATDGQTDGQMDRTAIAITRVSVLARDKNEVKNKLMSMISPVR